MNATEQITATIQKYIDGGRTGRSDVMKSAFHPDASIFGYLGDDLIAGPMQELYEWIDAHDAATELDARIANIDVEGTAATVRVEAANWHGHTFTDFFTLVCLDGEWTITTKVFYLHP